MKARRKALFTNKSAKFAVKISPMSKIRIYCMISKLEYMY